MKPRITVCENFERVINSIHSKRIYDIYITGSNAFLLSSDLATLFTGRTMEVKVYPFSFAEYLEYNTPDKNVNDAFDDYVRIGGMSGSYEYISEKQKYDYIKDVYDTILLRDLVGKYGIRNKTELLQISEFMMDNISNISSPQKICDTLNNNNSEITRKTVAKYIEYLERAFLFYEAKRYDLKGKKYLENNKKYYLCDIGFRYAVNGTRNMDFGRVYENLVYLELLRRGYTVYVGKTKDLEVDFVAKNREGLKYYQVALSVRDDKVLERELKSLQKTGDFYPKILLTMDMDLEADYNGIKKINVVDWLLSKEY